MLEEVLSKIPDVEPRAIERLRAHFDGVEDLLRSRDYEVAMISGLPLARAKEIMEFLRAHEPAEVAEGEVRRCEKCRKLVLNDTLCDSCRKGLCPRCGSYMDDMDECPVCGWRVTRRKSIAADFRMRWSSETEHLEEVLNKYAALLERYPDDPRLWEVKGEILEKMGRGEEAREAFRKAYDLYIEKEGRAPTSVIAHLGAADGLVEAFRRYSALAESEGTNPKLWEVAADLAARIGDRDYEAFARERARMYSDRWMEGFAPGRTGARKGFVNGKSRGFTNGRVNGRVNGHVNGRVNGMVNGAINGVVSRIVKEGLINGNGLVNGNTIARRIKPPRRPRWQRMVIASALLLVILLSPLLLYTFFVPYVQVGVDGSFEEWGNVPAIWDTRGDTGPDYIDIIDYRIIGMGESSYIYIRTAAPLFNRSSGVYVFIDADAGPGTGYPVAGLGADYMVEIYGWDGGVVRRGFYTYNSTAGGAWNGFIRVSGLPVAVNGNRMEMMVPVNVSAGDMAVVTTDYRGDVDRGDLKFAPARDLLGFRVTDANDIAPLDIWTPIVTVEYFTAGRCSIRWLNFSFEGTALPMDVSFRLIYRGENISFAVPGPDGHVNFTLSQPLALTGNGTISVEALPRGSTSLGRTVSVVPVSAGTDALLTVWDEREDRAYVGYVPSRVFIDGGFQDWSGVLNDPVGDVLDASGSSADVSYTTIDITGYAVQRTPRDTKFFISTQGRIMGGIDVPVVRNKTLVDSDRDTIPDYLDPHPHDFDNDNVSDSNEVVVIDNTSYPDVDSDGIPDYPEGDDYWLNTTIPNATEYGAWAGKNVSVYIGPVKGIRRLYGNDTVAIFIDADGNASTGFTAPFFAGADYMVEVSGRGGDVSTARLLMWNGTGWENVSGVDFASAYRSIEISANVTSPGMMRFFVVATNWLSYRDTIEAPYVSPSSISVRATAGDEILHLHYYSTTGTGYMDSLNGTLSQTTNIPAGGSFEWWQTPKTALDFNLTGATIYLYLVPYDFIWWIFRFVPSANVSLLIYNSTSGTYREVGYDYYPAVTDEGWYTFSILGSDVVRRGEALVVRMNVTGFRRTSIDVYYNSSTYDSRAVISSDSTIDVVDGGAWNSTTLEPQTVFSAGESAYLWANVTDVLGTYDIASVNFTVYYPNGTVWIDNATGTLYREGPSTLPYYAIYNISVTFPSAGGVYDVLVTARDRSGNVATYTYQVIVPVDRGVSLYPDGVVEAAPGTDAYWNFTLQNIGNVPLNVNLTADLSGGFPFDIYLNGSWVATDGDGDGLWDSVNASYDPDGNGVPSVYMNPLEYFTLTVIKHVPQGTEGRSDLTILNASAGDVYDTGYFRVNVPYRSVIKPLYLTAPSNLDIKYSGTTSTVRVNTGGSTTFSTPFGLYYSVNLTGYVQIYLYIVPTARLSWPWVTVNLYYNSTLIGFDRKLVDTTGWHVFYVDAAGVTIPAGSIISLTIEVSGGLSYADIYYDSSTYDSRVELPTTDYIRARWVKLYNATDETYTYRAGESVLVRTSLYTPFGPNDIGGANFTVYYPDGTAYTSGPMTVETASGGDAIFNSTFTLPADAPVGTWTVLVTYWDDPVVYGNISTNFVIPANVSIAPDNSVNTTPPAADTWFNFSHVVTNIGWGVDSFDIAVSGSPGYEVDLYIGGVLVAADYNGDGVWDFVDSNYDLNGNGIPDTGALLPGESVNITVSVLVPANSTTNFTLTVKATSLYSASIYDTATDTVTVVPEMNSVVAVFTTALMGAVIIRRKGKGRKRRDAT